MSDLEWLKLVDAFLTREASHSGSPGGWDGLRARLVVSEYYRLAYAQWTCGASHLTITRLLDAALAEASANA